MGSLIFNFFKRALLVPAIVTGIIFAALLAYLPAISASSDNLQPNEVNGSPDLSSYSSKQYSEFSELKSEDLIGTIACEAAGLGETPVLYNSQKNTNLSLLKSSSEPWNNGSVVVYGENRGNQFSPLHRAEVGDVVDFSFYSNNSYEYEIEEIKTGLSYGEISSFSGDNTLVLAYSYNDFSDLGNSYLYTVFIAKAL